MPSIETVFLGLLCSVVICALIMGGKLAINASNAQAARISAQAKLQSESMPPIIDITTSGRSCDYAHTHALCKDGSIWTIAGSADGEGLHGVP